MERLNPQISNSYWKVSLVLIVSIMMTSWISTKCYEGQRLPRSHLLKISELLRQSAEHSIRATQDSQPATAFADTSTAKAYVDIVEELLTPAQVQTLAGIDILEMKDFISKQHDQATEKLLQLYIDKKLGTRRQPIGGFSGRIL